MISGETVLDTLLDAGAVRGERNGVTVVAYQRLDVGLRRGDAAFLGDVHD
jgi:hypothetical protein